MTQASVLFVCLGNICRSPLAEAAFRAAAEKHGLDVKADSAGIAAYHVDAPPDPRSVETARDNDIDITHYRGRQLVAEDFTRFDYIFAMDHQNLRNIRSLEPADSSAQVSLLMDLVKGREGAAIADPYYDGEDQFDVTWADVNAAAHALVAVMVSERG